MQKQVEVTMKNEAMILVPWTLTNISARNNVNWNFMK